MNLFTKSWDACVKPISGQQGEAGVATLSCVWVVLQNIINAALILAGLVAVFLIIYSGFQYVTSNGDKEKVDAARKRLTFAIIGLILILLSFTFMNIFAQLTGIGTNQLLNPPQ